MSFAHTMRPADNRLRYGFISISCCVCRSSAGGQERRWLFATELRSLLEARREYEPKQTQHEICALMEVREHRLTVAHCETRSVNKATVSLEAVLLTAWRMPI